MLCFTILTSENQSQGSQEKADNQNWAQLYDYYPLIIAAAYICPIGGASSSSFVFVSPKRHYYSSSWTSVSELLVVWSFDDAESSVAFALSSALSVSTLAGFSTFGFGFGLGILFTLATYTREHDNEWTSINNSITILHNYWIIL